MVARRFFWPLVGFASLWLALAGASFATALFSNPAPRLSRRVGDYTPTNSDKLGVSEPEIRYDNGTEMLGRKTSLSWSSDRGFLIAAIVFGAGGLTILGGATRVRSL